MATASTTAKNYLEQNTTISDGIGCTIEHNMNSLVDNITITGADYQAADGSFPFKKLFPINSVLKAFRPVGAGVKYGIIEAFFIVLNGKTHIQHITTGCGYGNIVL